MRTFDDYKNIIESEMTNLSFIYSGDVIGSHTAGNNIRINDSNISEDFIKKTLVDIYNWSFEKMKQKSIEIIYKDSEYKDIISIFDDVYHKLLLHNNYSFPSILFFSKNSALFVNNYLIHKKSHLYHQQEFIPEFFYKEFDLTFRGNSITNFYSPLIEDESNDFVFYICDRPIQSMVWGIQNMTYKIDRSFSGFTHRIDYPLYDCDYQSFKIRVVNTQKIREEKIDIILND